MAFAAPSIADPDAIPCQILAALAAALIGLSRAALRTKAREIARAWSFKPAANLRWPGLSNYGE